MQTNSHQSSKSQKLSGLNCSMKLLSWSRTSSDLLLSCWFVLHHRLGRWCRTKHHLHRDVLSWKFTDIIRSSCVCHPVWLDLYVQSDMASCVAEQSSLNKNKCMCSFDSQSRQSGKNCSPLLKRILKYFLKCNILQFDMQLKMWLISINYWN